MLFLGTTQKMKIHKEHTSALFVTLAATLWAIDGVVLRPALASLPALLVVFMESSLVALCLTVFFKARLPELKQLGYKDWLAFFGTATFGGVVGAVAITQALFYVHFVNLSVVILIQKLQPVFALILAAVFLGERLPAVFFRWSALALVGAYLMTFGASLPNFDTGDKTAQAALWAAAAALSFASSTVLSKRALKNIDFGLGTYLRFAISASLLFLICLVTGNIPRLVDVAPPQAGIILIIALTTGGPAIFLYYFGLKKIKASVASICEMAFPLSAVLLEYLLRRNMLQPIQLLGAAMLMFSIFYVGRINVRGKNSSRADTCESIDSGCRGKIEP